MHRSQIKLFNPLSDHSPILLDTEEIVWGPKPILFNIVSLEDPNLMQQIKVWWEDSLFTVGHVLYFPENLFC